MNRKTELIINSEKPDMGKLPGGWEDNSCPISEHLELIENVYFFDILNHEECDKIIAYCSTSPNFENVSVQGRKDIIDDRVGSQRTTIWNKNLAKEIGKRILRKFPSTILADKFFPSDVWQENKSSINLWMALTCTPMLRYMVYNDGGEHYAHYDAGYIYQQTDYRTLYSFVLYLTEDHEGGATRFIKDGQSNIQTHERNHEDWTEQAKEEDVILSVKPKKGYVLLFPHRMCHDVEKFISHGEKRIIIRGDLLFKKIPYYLND